MHRIREWFHPYQPSIEHLGRTTVQYEEVEPVADLLPYVFCYWELKTSVSLTEPFMYRVVSDGCIDVLVEQSRPKDVFATGFSTRYLEYDLGTSFHYLGIRFLPAGFPALFEVAAEALTNQFIPLREVAPELYRTLHPGLTAPLSLAEAQSYWDTKLMAWLRHRDTPPQIDGRLLEAMHQILEARGGLHLAGLDVGVSERQLRRLFGYYFGESPKTFAKIVRFQNILAAKPSTPSLRQDKLFYDEGYYDQAHFIKEFKAFYGVTPTRAFGRIKE
ncbi:MAG TPA: AraC family transcriptional regulator [Cytophagales bacterium]|nr:AraC family transcriptional regulator [Cytophagales bacterium]HAP62498.1 AraC family transcriptional regulator [Cytophagales bacterium]